MGEWAEAGEREGGADCVRGQRRERETRRRRRNCCPPRRAASAPRRRPARPSAPAQTCPARSGARPRPSRPPCRGSRLCARRTARRGGSASRTAWALRNATQHKNVIRAVLATVGARHFAEKMWSSDFKFLVCEVRNNFRWRSEVGFQAGCVFLIAAAALVVGGAAVGRGWARTSAKHGRERAPRYVLRPVAPRPLPSAPARAGRQPGDSNGGV